MGLALAAGAAAAQAPTPAPDDGNSAVVAELTVIGHPPGPALWRVTRGDSEVVILGGQAPLVQRLDWNKVRLEPALVGAKVLLVPPSAKIGAFAGAGFILRLGAVRLPSGPSLEQVLPQRLSHRFANGRAGIGIGPQPYARWKPAVAGYLFLLDFRRKAGLSNEKPASTVEKMARAAHVPVKAVGDYRLGALFRSLTKLSDAQQLACLSAELDAVDIEAAYARDAGAAWASGDLATARAEASGPLLDRCIAQLSSYQQVLDRGTADFTAAIQAALATPGKAVAVIDLRYLLRADGVLDRLRAQGDVITVPGE
jgi:hypothetical protein